MKIMNIEMTNDEYEDINRKIINFYSTSWNNLSDNKKKTIIHILLDEI